MVISAFIISGVMSEDTAPALVVVVGAGHVLKLSCNSTYLIGNSSLPKASEYRRATLVSHPFAG